MCILSFICNIGIIWSFFLILNYQLDYLIICICCIITPPILIGIFIVNYNHFKKLLCRLNDKIWITNNNIIRVKINMYRLNEKGLLVKYKIDDLLNSDGEIII